jgi:hypothetical protein
MLVDDLSQPLEYSWSASSLRTSATSDLVAIREEVDIPKVRRGRLARAPESPS